MQARRRAGGQAAEEHRLAHRLGVLELVAQHHLVQLPRAGPREHVERAVADPVEIRQRPRPVEQLDLGAHGARGLERVVGRGQVGVQQGLAGQAVDAPEVLVCGDVAQVPDERAHDRVQRAVDDLVVEAGDERQGAVAHGAQALGEVGGHRRDDNESLGPARLGR